MADLVKLKTKKGEFEGVLMPRSEFYDKDFLSLRLKDGYVMGIRKSDIIGKKILKKKLRLEKFPRTKISKRKGLPDISLVSTGGTIASRIDYETGGVKMAMSPEEVMFAVPEMQDFVNISSVKQVFNLASEDICPEQWVRIARAVVRELNKGSRGVIVTHGTDTMHYTSAALSFLIKSSKPVVITGAQRSTDRGSSDTFMNLLCSAVVAGRSDMGETVLVFHENQEDEHCFALRGTRVRKMHTERRDAFRPINSYPLMRIHRNGSIEKISEYNRFSDGKARIDGGFSRKVALVKTYPGSDPGILGHYSQKVKGIIIEGTGFGHVPINTLDPKDSWIKEIRSLVKKGIFVGMTSQTIYGRTSSTVYRNLRILADAGVVHLSDMTPETAYVKLGWALSKEKTTEGVRKLMLTNVAGEISERTEGGWFLL
jgi:glutamyl-tRNA(Gln) amidotransferase subunit D